jgi:Peptidase M50B-like
VSTTSLILLYLAAALAISRLPMFRVYFSLCNTLIEKIIHVLAIVVTREGKSNKIKLYKNGSGETTSIVHSKIQKVMIVYIGYTGTLLLSMGLFYLLSYNKFHFIIYFFIGLLMISTLLWIRNLFGVLWALSFVVLLALPLYFRNELAIMHISIFLSSLILIQAIINAIQVIGQSFKAREKSGALAKTARIPAIICGIALLGQSLYATYFIFIKVLNLKLAMIRFELLEIIQIMEKFIT